MLAKGVDYVKSDGSVVEIYFSDLNQEARYILCNDIIAEMAVPIQNVIIKNDERTL